MAAKVNVDECIGCEVCVGECSAEAISIVDGVAKVDEDLCVDCGACVDACPNGAISL